MGFIKKIILLGRNSRNNSAVERGSHDPGLHSLLCISGIVGNSYVQKFHSHYANSVPTGKDTNLNNSALRDSLCNKLKTAENLANEETKT